MWQVAFRVLKQGAVRFFNLPPVKEAIAKASGAAVRSLAEAGGAIRPGFTNMVTHAGESLSQSSTAVNAFRGARNLGSASARMAAVETRGAAGEALTTSAEATAAHATTLRTVASTQARAAVDSIALSATAPLHGIRAGIGHARSALGHVGQGATQTAGHVWNSTAARTIVAGEVADKAGITDGVISAASAGVQKVTQAAGRILTPTAAVAAPKM